MTDFVTSEIDEIDALVYFFDFLKKIIEGSKSKVEVRSQSKVKVIWELGIGVGVRHRRFGRCCRK